jgi:hypothetical protein
LWLCLTFKCLWTYLPRSCSPWAATHHTVVWAVRATLAQLRTTLIWAASATWPSCSGLQNITRDVKNRVWVGIEPGLRR